MPTTACPHKDVEYGKYTSYTSSTTANWQDCGKMCKDMGSADCNYWTWISSTNQCRFRKEKEPVEEVSGAISGTKSCIRGERNIKLRRKRSTGTLSAVLYFLNLLGILEYNTFLNRVFVNLNVSYH